MKSKRERQRKILKKYIHHDRELGDSEHKYRIDQALSELSKLDAIPTSKEACPCSDCDTGWGGASTEGVETCHDSCERFQDWLKKERETWLKTPIPLQAVKPKEEVEQGRYNTQMLIEKMETQLDKGRNYLMSVRAENFNIEDALEAFGFGRNGLKL